MVDCFALLNQPRRPWLDLERLKAEFGELLQSHHPDRVQCQEQKLLAQRRFTELNEAYGRLEIPKRRLEHLLELEGTKKLQKLSGVKGEAEAFFLDFGRLGREADAFLDRRAQVTSPLLRVQMFEEGQDLAEKLGDFRERLRGWEVRLEARLKEVDRDWMEGADRAGVLGRIEELYHEFGFCQRWLEQIQERIVRISLE